MEFKADMHCHSTCSDGSLTPSELLHLAKKVGLSGLSITDHDTVEAYTPEIFSEAKELGIQLCPGVEFSTHLLNASVHILGYAFDIHSPIIIQFCHKHIARRRSRNLMILRRLHFKGLSIGEDELYPEGALEKVIGRPHIAMLMIKKGYVSSIKDAFERYIGDNKCCYDPGQPMSTLETINVIHQAGGKAFIAHPQLINRKKVLKELYKMPFDGLECYYSQFQHYGQNTLLEKAKEKNWLVSGGSDFHGEMRPFTPLGASWINKEAFDAIMRTT